MSSECDRFPARTPRRAPPPTTQNPSPFWGLFDDALPVNAEFTSAGSPLSVPPATLAEPKFLAFPAEDIYDVSMVDGFNVAVEMTPVIGTFEPVAPPGTLFAPVRSARVRGEPR